MHVVVGADGAMLDGLIISDGFARDATMGLHGAGLLAETASMTVHCVFTDNVTGDAPPPRVGTIGQSGGSGAGIYFMGESLVVEDCSFEGNRTGSGSEGQRDRGKRRTWGRPVLQWHGSRGARFDVRQQRHGRSGSGWRRRRLWRRRRGPALYGDRNDGAPSAANMPQGSTRLVGNVFADNEGDIGGALWIRTKAVAATDIVNSSFSLNTANLGGAIWYQVLGPEGEVDAGVPSASVPSKASDARWWNAIATRSSSSASIG